MCKYHHCVNIYSLQVQEMVMTKRDAEILLGMAGGDLERAIELFVGLPWNHKFKASDVK